MKLKTLFLIILIISSGIFYYRITGDSRLNVRVLRVIDGDTIILNNGQRVRLKGINTPEKKMPLYREAKDFLKRIENKSVEIEITGTDKYHRLLAYVFYNNQNINKELLKKGLANLYYYEHDKYYNQLSSARDFAHLNQLGIWKESKNKNCISLIDLRYIEPKKCTNSEQLVLRNLCNKTFDIIIKDRANHITKTKINSFSRLTKNFSCVFNDEGDDLYVWDQQGLLIYYTY